MSMGFLLNNKDDPIVWRGPKKNGIPCAIIYSNWSYYVYLFVSFIAMIKTFLTDVYWQDVDYLIIDTPPGTSDEHITVMENLK